MKGLPAAGAQTLQQANAYWESEYLPWWNQSLTVKPAIAADAYGRWAKRTIWQPS